MRELHGGHQARVFEAGYADGRQVVAKVVDAALVDAVTLSIRVDVVAALAHLDAMVCRPIPIDGRLVTHVSIADAEGLVTVYEHADGVAMDTADRGDAVRMGQVLAGLHEAMRGLPRVELPMVAALADTVGVLAGPDQLLHGDFNAGNLHQHEGSIKVFDFDDCGYGPPAFDVANALYMVRFDAIVGQHAGLYERFAEGLLEGYAHDGGATLDAVLVTELIDRRVDALASWLDDPRNAPIGIRTATPQWHAALRGFVSEFRAQQDRR